MMYTITFCRGEIGGDHQRSGETGRRLGGDHLAGTEQQSARDGGDQGARSQHHRGTRLSPERRRAQPAVVQKPPASGAGAKHLEPVSCRDRARHQPGGPRPRLHMDLAGLHRTNEECSAIVVVAPQRHLARIVDTAPDFDGEAGRQLDLFQREIGCEQCTGKQREEGSETALQSDHASTSEVSCVLAL